MGNINSIVDINGKTMVKYYYNTFCEPVIITLDETDEDYNLSLALSKCNVFLYKGYIYDVETNFALVSSRHYSPELGRFIYVQVNFLTAKFFFIYEDGKLKIDSGFGWVDFGISIDIAAIIDYLKGNG